MSLSVSFSPRAIANIEKLADWAGQFSNKARTNLLAAITDKIQHIELQPEMYPVSAQYPPLRRCIVSSTVVLYYRIQPDSVEIVGVADSRRDPTDLL